MAEEKKEETWIAYDEPTEFKRIIVNTKTKEGMDVATALAKMMNTLDEIKNSLK
jgi:hypothetical protein